MILPYKMETTFARYPFANAAIIAFTSIFHFLVLVGIVPYETFESMVLQEWNMGQLTGNMMLHGDIFHLIGNMLFLWIFGNAVCALVGNLSYFFIYVFLGICASAAHLIFDGHPAIGASGAINGIVGMTLVFFPVNKLHSIALIPIPGYVAWGKIAVKTFWMIAYWFVFDIGGVVFSGDNIAYWAHVGGFAAGALTGFILVKLNFFETYDATMFDLINGTAPVVDRSMMDLEELERQEQKRRRDEERMKVLPAPSPDVAAPAAIYDASPCFRVLKVGRKDADVFCYFINEGDRISNAVVQSPYAAEIQPPRLDTKAPGWIRFTTYDEINLEQLQLDISFNAGVSRLTKQMKFDPSAKKFVVL